MQTLMSAASAAELRNAGDATSAVRRVAMLLVVHLDRAAAIECAVGAHLKIGVYVVHVGLDVSIAGKPLHRRSTAATLPDYSPERVDLG